MTGLPLTIIAAAAAFRAGTLTSVALTEEMLALADHLDPLLGVYITRMDVSALAAARQADADFASGVDKGPLQGIPIGVKDIIATKDAPTTGQSQVLDPWWGSGHDAPVVARLRAAGAVIMGKTTTMEFAIGAPDPAKPFPVPKNPWNLAHWPGGSSSGSGSGVATGLFLGALGTDTGGSIRGPASFCGISGMKQTFGRVPKSGCVSLGYSYDHIGPMARSSIDCAILLKVIAGHDPSDLTSIDEPVPDYPSFLDGSLAGMKIGVDRKGFLAHPNQEPEIVTVFEAALTTLANAGAKIVEITIPYLEEMGQAMNAGSRAESFTYHKLDLRDRRHLYGIHTSDALNIGSAVTGWEYVQSQRFRTFARKTVGDIMAPLDVLLTPTNGAGAPLLAGMDATAMMTRPSHTRYFNYLGLPAFAIPMGFNDAGLPLSLQVVAKPFDESTAFRIADAYQRLTAWHLKVPPIASRIPAMAG